MNWLTSYVGAHVAVVANSDDAYQILTDYDLTSWQSGGCAILAKAISIEFCPAPSRALYALKRKKDGVIDHVVARLNDGYLDADGAFTGRGLVEKHLTLEGVSTRLVRIGPNKLPTRRIVCPADAVERLVALFSLILPEP